MRLGTRSLVIIGSIAWITLIIAILTQGAYGWLWWTTLAVFFLTWILARVLFHDIAEKRLSEVDEYEATLRNRARNIGYWSALLGGNILFVCLSIFAREARSGNPGLLLHAPHLLFALVLAASAVPTFVLTWTTRIEND